MILVDPEDEYLLLYNWRVQTRGNIQYAVYRPTVESPKKQVKWYMHKLIMGYPDEDVDHINGNGLDNRRSNLRIGTQINKQNRVRTVRGRSLPLGVSEYPGGYRAQITARGQKIHIGCYETPGDAHRAYRQKRIEIGVPLQTS